ncbi:MAG: aminodeoxychorismate lyase [Betaproteobacteria bacterium RIFCSPLOWO2_12_FULL_66_14]|nr:MAG: aminodeoxychorismate lyase [Betaproteobacteria bacterium RIFCSPLOWO2_12_FULL_66_14]
MLLLMLVIGVAAAAGWLAWFAKAPVALPAQAVDFSIVPGSSLKSATRQIIDAGIPISPNGFNILARIYGKQTQIKAGSYELRDGATPWTLLQKITQGDFQMTEMVFIEGWNFGQMRAALDGHAHVRHDTRDMTDGEIMARLGAPGVPPEGMFFPDTYLFAKGESDLAILARAHRLMNKELESAWESRAPDLPLSSAREALVLASIVEKETGDAKERPLIAGVFVNRLRRGMRLQTDPTVIYGMGERFDGNLRRKDLESDTPFNTYTREGLPPHPIAMPGRAALRAVVSPTQTDALYFVSKGDGTHQFSRSIDDHNRAVARYQKAATRK